MVRIERRRYMATSPMMTGGDRSKSRMSPGCLMKLKNTLRWLKGQLLITHLGTEYYD